MFQGQFVFPDADDVPAGPTQRAVHQTVACLVRGQLLPPESPVATRLRAVLRARMPEAAVHKHHDPGRAKYKIGTDAKGARCELRAANGSSHRTPLNLPPPHFDVSSPAHETVPPKKTRQGRLRARVPPRTHAGHHRAAFCLGENVGHGNRKRPEHGRAKTYEREAAGCPGRNTHEPPRASASCRTPGRLTHRNPGGATGRGWCRFPCR